MIKKFMFILLSLTVILSTLGFAFAEEVIVTTETTVVDDSSQVSPQKIDLSESINLSGGDTWKKTFDMNRWWPADPHDAFDVKVTDVTGSYKVLIISGDGFYYSSNTYTNTGVTITITNAKPDVNYSVSVVNANSDKELKAQVSIISYYEQ